MEDCYAVNELPHGNERENSIDDEKKVPSEDLTRPESTEYITGSIQDLDVGLALAAGHVNDSALDPAACGRLRRKLDWHILPLLCAVYTGMLRFISRFLCRRLIPYSSVHRQVS